MEFIAYDICPACKRRKPIEREDDKGREGRFCILCGAYEGELIFEKEKKVATAKIDDRVLREGNFDVDYFKQMFWDILKTNYVEVENEYGGFMMYGQPIEVTVYHKITGETFVLTKQWYSNTVYVKKLT
jgi:Zn ribbon nucleic-acid-binding protein